MKIFQNCCHIYAAVILDKNERLIFPNTISNNAMRVVCLDNFQGTNHKSFLFSVLIASGLKAELVSRLLKHRQQTESKNEGADTAETANGKNKRKAEETEEDKNVLKRSKSKNGSQPLLKRSGSVRINYDTR